MRTIADLMRVHGRTALVTGAAGHIGRACCEALAELGADIAVADLDAAACVRTADTLRSRFGVRAEGMSCNLAKSGDAAKLVAATVDAFRRIDIVVHCAAYTGATKSAGWAVPFEEQTVDAWNAALQVNLTSAFELAQAAAKYLAAHPHSGSVVLVGSIYGSLGPQLSLYDGTGMANPMAYGASKGGLLQLTRYLAATMSPKVRVNCLSPGGVARGQDPRFIERYEARTPLSRMATEEDLKGAFAYLATDAAAYVTGHNLMVDGGFSAW